MDNFPVPPVQWMIRGKNKDVLSWWRRQTKLSWHTLAGGCSAASAPRTSPSKLAFFWQHMYQETSTKHHNTSSKVKEYSSVKSCESFEASGSIKPASAEAAMHCLVWTGWILFVKVILFWRDCCWPAKFNIKRVNLLNEGDYHTQVCALGGYWKTLCCRDVGRWGRDLKSWSCRGEDSLVDPDWILGLRKVEPQWWGLKENKQFLSGSHSSELLWHQLWRRRGDWHNLGGCGQ